MELAIGATLFVTVLVGGIAFAEAGWLSLEVVESANTAVFDTTAAKLHRIWDPLAGRADWTPYKNAITSAGPAATARHATFDSRAAQVFTQAKQLAVSCVESPRVPSLAPRAQGFPRGDSGMACEAEAELGWIRVPTSTVGGWSTTPVKLHTGRFGVLLDDWGLAGPDERKECRLFEPCQNPGFHDLALQTYGSGVNLWGGAAEALLDHVTKGARPLPMREGRFRMSFRGSESSYLEILPGSHGDVPWETTAFKWPIEYSTPRSRCWLGDPC